MNLEKSAHWIAIVGNLGLLIGVALVVVQISQNSALMREQLAQDRWTDRMNWYLAIMGENPAASLAKADEDPEALTYEDAKVINADLSYWILAETRMAQMYTIRYLSNRYIKARFDQLGFRPANTPRVRPLMDSISGTENREEYLRIKALMTGG